MKATASELLDLKKRIAEAKRRRALNNADIASLANVDPSQVSRICSGSFATVSANVVQVCKVLGLRVETLRLLPGSVDPDWAKMEQSLRSLWDRTPSDAELISVLLNDIARFRRSS